MGQKLLLYSAFMLFSINAFSQTGINTITPSATFHVEPTSTVAGTAEGIIAPRLSKSALRAKEADYGGSNRGAIVYVFEVDSAITTKTANISNPGYYYFDGEIWQKLSRPDSEISNSSVNLYKEDGTLTSNRILSQASNTLAFTSAATTGTSHFTVDGTTLNVNAVDDKVGIGTAYPTAKLHVSTTTGLAALRLVDGTQGANKVLISDSIGVASWKDIGFLQNIVGDVKYSALNSDHNGWYLLNGRDISILPASAITNATNLGFTANLPDATNRVFKQIPAIIAGILGGNSENKVIRLAQANLPNVNFTGSTNVAGNHSHIYIDRGNTTFSASTTNNLSPIADNTQGYYATNPAGDHSHSVTVNSGGSASPINVGTEDSYLSLNSFIYLGL